MSDFLIIVESPTKAKTIYSFLKDNYNVVSSMGHIVDLAKNKLSVDIENGFKPYYYVLPNKRKIIAQLKEEAKNKKAIYIATDPDREGEAIGWHIKNKLSGENNNFYRIIFHEITEEAIKEALKNPRDIDLNLVNSQIARRVLDRIVGYYLSPLLWKKVLRGLSAGRVQSVALRFIVDREKEIKNFVPKTTYGIEATYKVDNSTFKAKLEKYKDKKGIFDKKEDAILCMEELKKENFFVKDIIKKETKRTPPPPFTTSLLQQEAFNVLGFSSQKTMLVAQSLYEGVKVNDKMLGLITYMRTDSFSVSKKAQEEVERFIKEKFGENYFPEKIYKRKEKETAQLAHEAIRPTDVFLEPKDLKKYLTEEQFKLYELIWVRFCASFMKEALIESTKVIISSNLSEFVSNGKRILFDGFLKILNKKEEEEIFPLLEKNQSIELSNLEITTHTTKPPPRFNDASLVKLMEEKGIGRPSTYAPTIATLIKRNYIKRYKGYFIPTELGIKVVSLLVRYFPDITDEKFTAIMEKKLDEVEEGKISWTKILEDFYPSFKKKIEEGYLVIKKDVEISDKKCPKCGGNLLIRWSRNGKFLSCQNFPKCRYAENITTDIICPNCKTGKLVERKNKKNQFFYGCSRYPECNFTTKELPKE